MRGRCRSTNQCEYCATLGAVENSEMLALDGLYGRAPTFVAILGTRTPSIEPRDFYRAREQLLRALRRRWEEVEWAALVEFTTGQSARSGGRRYPHWNLLIKGVPDDDGDQLRDVVIERWCARVDAAPQAQYVSPIGTFGGLVRYVAQHFQKQSQRPPDGWRGHRFLATDGYLWVPRAEARERARESLRERRALWRATVKLGLVGDDAERYVREELAIAAATSWELVQLSRDALCPGNAPASPRGAIEEQVPAPVEVERATSAGSAPAESRRHDEGRHALAAGG